MRIYFLDRLAPIQVTDAGVTRAKHATHLRVAIDCALLGVDLFWPFFFARDDRAHETLIAAQIKGVARMLGTPSCHLV